MQREPRGAAGAAAARVLAWTGVSAAALPAAGRAARPAFRSALLRPAREAFRQAIKAAAGFPQRVPAPAWGAADRRPAWCGMPTMPTKPRVTARLAVGTRPRGTPDSRALLDADGQLAPVHAAIYTPALQKPPRRAVFDDAAPFEHNDAVEGIERG